MFWHTRITFVLYNVQWIGLCDHFLAPLEKETNQQIRYWYELCSWRFLRVLLEQKMDVFAKHFSEEAA